VILIKEKILHVNANLNFKANCIITFIYIRKKYIIQKIS